jgi:hypothetical protein
MIPLTGRTLSPFQEGVFVLAFEGKVQLLLPRAVKEDLPKFLGEILPGQFQVRSIVVCDRMQLGQPVFIVLFLAQVPIPARGAIQQGKFGMLHDQRRIDLQPGPEPVAVRAHPGRRIKAEQGGRQLG